MLNFSGTVSGVGISIFFSMEGENGSKDFFGGADEAARDFEDFLGTTRDLLGRFTLFNSAIAIAHPIMMLTISIGASNPLCNFY
jgi:hypothetical protein